MLCSPARPLAKSIWLLRKLLQKRNSARHFTHSTGHGLGLEITRHRESLQVKKSCYSREW